MSAHRKRCSKMQEKYGPVLKELDKLLEDVISPEVAVPMDTLLSVGAIFEELDN